MRISFDFDDCLSDNLIVQQICKSFLDSGNDIYILSNRDPQISNSDVFRFVESFGIKKENILLIGVEEKYHHFFKNQIDIHFDNSIEDVSKINDMFDKKESEKQPAILVNFNSQEISNIYNYVR